MKPRRSALRALVCSALIFLAASSGHADAVITVINLDGVDEGFNDPTVVAPVDGNPATTLGQQRLIAFQAAADALADLEKEVPALDGTLLRVNGNHPSKAYSFPSGIRVSVL